MYDFAKLIACYDRRCGMWPHGVRCMWRVDLTVGVVWRAGRSRGLAQAGRGVRRPPLLPCCQEYLHVPSTTVYPKPVGLPTVFPYSQR